MNRSRYPMAVCEARAEGYIDELEVSRSTTIVSWWGVILTILMTAHDCHDWVCRKCGRFGWVAERTTDIRPCRRSTSYPHSDPTPQRCTPDHPTRLRCDSPWGFYCIATYLLEISSPFTLAMRRNWRVSSSYNQWSLKSSWLMECHPP